ncbi:MAG: hypothetical protein FRX48_05331 [Lasallia pustulata]|uniref:HSP20-like chaperone n=1 Tax=Lasallia pustulata TaxID=136370 RepID=A0A5M8PQ26_9LECA|nr:MAG: hypothetical protein FRX48_05331 [Lasallia pustulata]
MAQKCVHKGCGKKFSDPEEDCIYHPGPPVFHEGQKGWKCCKPRVLTFDEFLSIPPCTTGKHSTTDDVPVPEPPKADPDATPIPAPTPVGTTTEASNGTTAPSRLPQRAQLPPPESPSHAPAPDSDSDDPSLPIPPNTTCRRRACAHTSPTHAPSSRDGEECIYHPGQPIFHEGSKGWTCCKRRVLEFDQFMRIEGCQKKPRHLYVGRRRAEEAGTRKEEEVSDVRHDFYQTATTVIASLYLKKIDKARAVVAFSEPATVELDLPTSDQKRYAKALHLYGPIDAARSGFKIMGTKVELSLAKADGSSWPVLRRDERGTGEIIQVGRAGRA